jgi:hypothetical protein
MPDEAERLAEQVERDLVEIGPVAVLPATLTRLRGWASLLLGRTDEAHDRFRHALDLAREESFAYEVALALDALIATRCDSVREDERQQLGALVRDLDVVQVPRPAWF